MSSFLAIAGVSSTLRSLLRDRMQNAVDVTIAPPDVALPGMTGQRVNLYLYKVSENPYLKNQEIPGHGHPGDFGRPPLSLELHYIMTAYGSADTNPDADLQAQQLLADAMQVFHEFPIVTDSLHQGDNPLAPVILDASLLGEFEKVKIALEPTKFEELSNVWTALPQANFRRSVTYQVSVVQIESTLPRRSALPVRVRQVNVFPLRTPKITSIRREPPFPAVEGAIAEAGDTIVIEGYNLAGAGVNMVVAGFVIPIPTPQDTRITVALPAAIPSGVHALTVSRDLLLPVPSGPPVAHRGFSSNAMPLLVAPRFGGVAPDPAAPGDLLTVNVTANVTALQSRILLVGDFAIEGEAVAPDAPPSGTVTFRLPTGFHRIPAGTYFVRLRIDGAESRLDFNPATGLYTGPNLTLS